MERHRASPLLVAVLALAPAACSKTPTPSRDPSPETASAVTSPPPSASPPAAASAAISPAMQHPCKLLDNATVQAALGTAEFTPQETPGKAPYTNGECTWHVPKGGGFVEVSLQYVPETKEHFGHIFHLMNETEFPGLGDAAFVDHRMKWGHVDVLVHQQKLMVQVSRGNVATGFTAGQNTMQDTTIVLARKVVAAL